MQRAEIQLYGQIGEAFLEGNDAKSVVAQVKAAGASPIDVHIHSSGGSVFDGYTIYNALASHAPGVDVYIDGLAASIAAYVAMAGQKITMAENAMMMIHNPTIDPGRVDRNKMQRQMQLLDKVTQSYADAFTKRGLTAEQVSGMMADETWFTAAEALLAGLIDEISPQLALAASFDLSQFKHAPESARQFDITYKIMSEKIEKEPVAADETKPEPQPPPPQPAKEATILDKLNALLKPKADLQIEINSLKSQVEVRDASIAALNTDIATLKSELETVRAQAAELPAIQKLVADLETEKKTVEAVAADKIAALGFPQDKLPAATQDKEAEPTKEPTAKELLETLNAIKDPAEFTRTYRKLEKEIKAAWMAEKAAK